MIRAPGRVKLLNRRSSQRARLGLPNKPKLLPNIKIVSNSPRRRDSCVTDNTFALRRPRSFAVLIDNGEISTPRGPDKYRSGPLEFAKCPSERSMISNAGLPWW